MADFRETIRARLAELGWTQTEAAERAGVSRTHLCSYLAGQRAAHSETLERLCEALGLELRVTKHKAKA